MSLDFTDTRIHPIYGLLEDGHLCALFMLEGSWSAPCFCPKGTLGLSTRADSSPPLLEITAEAWRGSDPPFPSFQSHLPYTGTLQSTCTTSSECWRSEAACDKPTQGFPCLILYFCNTTVSRFLPVGTRPVFAEMTAGLMLVLKLWVCFLWGFLTYRCCLEQVTDTSHFFCQQHNIGCPPCSQA